MTENPDFRHEPNLSVRLNRREFLKLSAATAGGVILQAACGSLEQITVPSSHPIDQSLEIPNSYINDLKEVIAPLTKLMPSIRQNVAIEVSKTRNGINLVSGRALRSNNEIRILIPDVSPENMAIGKVIAFHETAHLFDQGDNIPSDYLKEEMIKRTGRNIYVRDENAILKESSYCSISACWNMGHPEDGFDEIFASSITILRFYPSEFIEKLEKLSSPESKRFLATNGMVCIDALKKLSSIPVEYNDLPFDPNLVTYLIQESQNSVP